MLVTQQPTKVSHSKFHNEATGENVQTELHETATQIKVYSDNALLATVQKVADGYQLDGYVFELFLELMEYLLIGDATVVYTY